MQYVLQKYLQPALDKAGPLHEGPTIRIDRAQIKFSIHLTSRSQSLPDANDAIMPQSVERKYKLNESDKEPWDWHAHQRRRMVSAVALLGVTILHVIWYNLVTWNVRNRVFFRGYILFAALFICLAATAVFEMLWRRSKQYRRELVATEDDDEMLENMSVSGITMGELGNVHKLTNYYDFELEVSRGRPVLDEVLQPAMERESPAVFYCGPNALWREIHDKIRKERKAAFGFRDECAFSKKISSFELQIGCNHLSRFFIVVICTIMHKYKEKFCNYLNTNARANNV